VTFAFRLAILVVLLSIAAAIDWWWYRAAANRWREYLFLLAAALLGALFGIANDHVTPSISTQYFTVGKGLPIEGFRLEVTGLGFQAGFGAGAVVGMLLLFANRPRPGRRSVSLTRLFPLGWWPLAAALLLAPVGAWAAWRLDPLHFAAAFAGVFSHSEIARFQLVWGIHAGLYAGGLLGTGYALVRLGRLGALDRGCGE
jgi:hypothetical protein